MPKRVYHTGTHASSYESGYTKLARLQSELSHVSKSVEDCTEFHPFEDNETSTLHELVQPIGDPMDNASNTRILLQNLLQIEAPINRYGDGRDGNGGESDCDSDDEFLINQHENPNSVETTDSLPNLPTKKDTPIKCSVTHHAMIDLINCCNQAGTSIKFFDDFLRLLKRHVRLGFDILKAPKRSTFMDKLATELRAPQAEVVTSVDGYIVPRYNFLDQLLDLLSTEYFESVESCCVNVEEACRYAQYVPPIGEGESEVMGSKWSRTTHKEKIQSHPTFTDPNSGIVYHNWLLPLIIYNDKTGVGAMEGKYTLEPLMFTVAVIRREFREKAEAWRHMGFVPKHNSGSSKEESCDVEVDAEERLGVFHRILSLLLESLEGYQKNPPLLHLKLFGQMVRIRPILDVAFVIGDQLSQDHHCGRKKVNSGGASRAHRACMCSFQTAGKADVVCHPVDKKTIHNLITTIQQGEDKNIRTNLCIATYPTDEDLGPRHPLSIDTRKKRISFSTLLKTRSATAREILEKTYGIYPVKNAWFPISFGATTNGIYEATLDDPFHFSESGMFMYLISVAFKGLLPADAKKIEKYLREDFSARCSVRYDLPRGKFSPGFTNCTLLTGSEKVGLVFSLYLSLGTKRVSDIFHSNIIRQQTKYLDHNCCYDALGLNDPQHRPSESCLPKIWDQYYYSDLRHAKSAEKSGRNYDHYELPRNKRTIRKLVDNLDAFGLLFVVDPVRPPLDQLQTEYLLQTVWHRTARKPELISSEEHIQYIKGLVDGSASSKIDKDKVVLALFSKIRRGTPPLLYNQKNTSNSLLPTGNSKQPTPTGTIRSFITKHWIQKPKVKGRGDTSCILTDVGGFRRVLEYALIYHSIVHEYHHLSPSLQTDYVNLDKKLQELMNVILSGIYRGDNSVDVNTCKIHSHFHLSKACQNFGCPMNFDASKGERGLKTWAIHASKTARKCGDATFITQTAKRVADNLLLWKAKRLAKEIDNGIVMGGTLNEQQWGYTRTVCHLVYNLETNETRQPTGTFSTPITYNSLLGSSIKSVLKREHGTVGLIEIWREVFVRLGDQSKHYIRAFETYDDYGAYFDWAQVKDIRRKDDYVPAKVLLLYRFKETSHAVVWKALPATSSERNKETNISARWKMSFSANEGLPELVSVPVESLVRCLHVFEHKKRIDGHIPTSPVDEAERSRYLIDESYDRHAWALNFLDDSRWSQSTSRR